ncbi:MAG: DUF4168 domain-containing protein [Candidatus Binatia bacterium]
MKFNLLKSGAVALLIVSSIAMGLDAAQETKPSARPEMAISEKELNSFVRAYTDYQRIRASYGPALDQATDSQQKKRIEDEANQKVKQSLAANGLTADRYNRIFAAANSDEGLRKKVLKRVQDQRQKS